MPEMFIIAGPNGAGKTTASKRLLPEVFGTDIFINADIIAAKLNPSNPESVAMRAGRIMLEEIDKRIEHKETFAIETTLASRSYLQLVRRVQLLGYEVVLYFFYLPSAEMAKQRVALRVSKGGHFIPEAVIERRYVTGIRYLFEYIALVNAWAVFQNDNTPPELIAEGELDNKPIIHKFEIWELLKKI